MISEIKEKYAELAEQKRSELERAIERGDVADPIFTPAFFISLAVSAAVSTASYLVSRAFAPKPPRLQQGKLTGSLQLQNSEQGIFIPEIYGAGPSISTVSGSNPTYVNTANVNTGGGNGSITKNVATSAWDAGASHTTSVVSGDEAFFKFVIGTGYSTAGFSTTASPRNGNTDFKFGIQWNPDGSVSIKYNGTSTLGNVTTWATGDTFRIELRKGRFRLYKGSAEIIPQNFVAPTPTYPLYLGIAMFTNGAGISNGKVQINSIGDAPNAGRGGVKVPAIIVWSSGIRKHVSTTTQPTGGGKGGGSRQTVENITYDIDLGMMYARGNGGLNLVREYGNADILIDQFMQSPNPSGVYDPGVGPDPDYDPTTPPDPSTNYLTPRDRVDLDLTYASGVATGTVQGGGSSFAVYQGTSTQAVDSVIEADTDAKYGTGSTPAYRNRAYVRHSNFDLSRWGGVVPNFTAVWEHATLKTLDAIFGSLCERVGVLAASSDYDFTGLSSIKSRGLLIAGRPFAPAEVIDDSEIKLAYNYFVTEANGQIVGYTEGSEPTVTIPDTEIGWLDGEDDLPDIAPEVDSILAPEISLPREIIIKSIDPDRDWDADTQNAIRQITEGQTVELLEIQIVQLADERRATAQRALYQRYVAGTAHKFTLDWKYLYLYPGYKITITRAEGFTHTVRLTSITGGIGVLECEGIALEPEVFTQPANGVFPPGYRPSQPIPAMTIAVFLDTPMLRDGDETNNNGVGFYWGAVPRTSVDQTWNGAALYVGRNGEWSIRSSSNLPATIGTIVSATSLSSDTSVLDNSGVFTVDLYGTTATLSSISQADALADATKNVAVCGDMVIRFLTASQVGGFPNRWQLSGLYTGQRGTENHISDTFTNKRFVLIDDAVKFVPTEIRDLNTTVSYRAVTSGQSLDDAATATFVWTGGVLRPLSPIQIKGTRDTSNNLYLSWIRRDRVNSVLRDWAGTALSEEAEIYQIEVLVSGSPVRTVRIREPQFQIFVPQRTIPFDPTATETDSLHIGPQRVDSASTVIRGTTSLAAPLGGFAHGDGVGFIDNAVSTAGNVSWSIWLEAFSSGVSTRVLRVYLNGSVVSTTTITSYYTDDTPIKLVVEMLNHQVECRATVSGRPEQIVYRANIDAADLGSRDMRGMTMNAPTDVEIRPQRATWLYTADQQTDDGITPGDPVTVRLAQESAFVGLGDKVTVTV